LGPLYRVHKSPEARLIFERGAGEGGGGRAGWGEGEQIFAIQLGHSQTSVTGYSDGIFKLLRSSGINSKESIPPAYVACARILG